MYISGKSFVKEKDKDDVKISEAKKRERTNIDTSLTGVGRLFLSSSIFTPKGGSGIVERGKEAYEVQYMLTEFFNVELGPSGNVVNFLELFCV